MIEWVDQLQDMLQRNDRLVLVTVASVKGSTPREPGAKMLVSANALKNTIGGGHLEYKAIQLARNMLADNRPDEIQQFCLAAGLGQCCGGVVTLFFEVISVDSDWLEAARVYMSNRQDFVRVIALDSAPGRRRLMVSNDTVIADYSVASSLISIARNMLKNASITTIKKVNNIELLFDPVKAVDFNVTVFGAGHVGKALIRQLAEQPCRVDWVDTRDNQLPQLNAANVTAINTDTPEAVIDAAAAGSYFVVMTHDHSLDQQLAEQILKRNDFAYFGLIGSLTKRKKFEHRLRRRGINQQQLSRMTCPVGIAGIQSKQPAAIALAITAELVRCYEQAVDNRFGCSQQAGRGIL